MSSPRSLRNRVALVLAGFSGLVALALALTVYLWFRDLEQRLIDETLVAELDDLVGRRARNPAAVPEHTATIRAYVIDPVAAGADVPAVIAALSPGQHSLQLGEVPYRAAVRRVEGKRYAVLYDERALYRREHGFLALLVVSSLVITLVSAWAGRWLAGRTISPVTELARRVADMHPEHDVPPLLAEQFPWEEVQLLAADFDSYIQRLHDFIERERLFTGDVSHELRTPLAVIKGATELLLDDPGLGRRHRARVARIDRSVAQMAEISGALLALAREEEGPGAIGECEVRAVAEELVARYRRLVRDKPVRLLLSGGASPRAAAPPAVLAMVLGNLLRNAVTFTQEGDVLVRIEEGAVFVEDSGPGIGEQDPAHLFRPYVRGKDSGGAGLGLSLVQRLCRRHGWEISLSNRSQGGTRAGLYLNAEANGTPAPGKSE